MDRCRHLRRRIGTRGGRTALRGNSLTVKGSENLHLAFFHLVCAQSRRGTECEFSGSGQHGDRKMGVLLASLRGLASAWIGRARVGDGTGSLLRFAVALLAAVNGVESGKVS